MRSYGEYCSVAKALDVVGDRWTFLIVRELLIRGACRYTDLKDGLPGIATNLLSDRIRELEGAGLIRREDAPPPIATTLFHLTDTGAELRPVLDALGQWGVRYMTGLAEGDQFRAHWASLFLRDRSPAGPPVSIELRQRRQPCGHRGVRRLGDHPAWPGHGAGPRRAGGPTPDPRPVLGPAHPRRRDGSWPGGQRRRDSAGAPPARGAAVALPKQSCGGTQTPEVERVLTRVAGHGACRIRMGRDHD